MLPELRRSLTPMGLVRGVLGGSRPWLAVAVAGAGFRLLKRMVGKQPEVVFREELKPGQAVVISHLTPVQPRRRARSQVSSEARLGDG